jgi:hypothetical protein
VWCEPRMRTLWDNTWTVSIDMGALAHTHPHQVKVIV